MNKVQMALKDRYKGLHPLLFLRSLEKARTDGELFDILDSIPKQYPVIWNEYSRKWEVTNLLQEKAIDVST